MRQPSQIRLVLIGATLSAGCGFAPSSAEADFWSDTKAAVRKGIDDTANAAKIAADATAAAAKKAADDTAAAAKKAAEDTARATKKAADDTAAATKKAAEDTARATKKAADDAAAATKKAADDTAAATKKAADDTVVVANGAEKGLDHFGNEFGKWFCSTMTLGGTDNGTASCSVSAGVNSNGRLYDPSNPTQYQPIPDDRITLPSQADLDTVYASSPQPELEDWERRQDAIAHDLLSPGDQIGIPVPWVTSGHALHSPTQTGDIRDTGHFLDLRHDTRYPGNYRFHGGVDYLNKVGDPVFAIGDGAVTRTFVASEDGREAGLSAVEIIMPGGYSAQYLYIQPADKIAQQIANQQFPIPVHSGEVIGYTQDLHTQWTDETGATHTAYPLNVPQHVHVSLKDIWGRYVSPDGQKVITMKRGQKSQVQSTENPPN